MARCFICGDPAQIGRFCKRCFRNQNPPIKHFAPMVIKVCSSCPAIKIASAWVFDPLPDSIPSIIRKKVIVNEEYKVKSIIVKPVSDAEQGFHPVQYDVRLVLKSGKHEFEEFYQVPVQFQKQQCDRCAKSKSSYFVSILQLRGASAIVEEFISGSVEKAHRKGVVLTRRVAVQNGYDYYLTSNKFASQLGTQLKHQFGGDIHVSKTLHTHKGGRDLYRVTVLYRAPPVFKGEYISLHGHVLEIVTTTDDIKAKDLNTNKISKLSSTMRSWRRLVPLPTTISKTRPQLEALHPLTFQSVPVRNKLTKRAGQKILVVFSDYDGVFVVK